MSDIFSENPQLRQIFELFLDKPPIEFEIKSTSRGDNDFREAVIVKCTSGEKYVIKIADNDFTNPKRIKIWKRCSEEYRRLSYYCPAILPAKNGSYPIVLYKEHRCVVYMEEFSKYKSADNFDKALISNSTIMKDAFIMTAKVAAQKFDFSCYPSGYCLFDRFCSSDSCDEVMENALEWKRYVKTLPAQYQDQVQRIWQRWIHNRESLERIYGRLPTSVFQADLNWSNLLLDDAGNFVGVLDFNLCGKDVFLNYLFREIRGRNYQEEIDSILMTIKNISRFYTFSDIEKEAALLLYRCIKPLWFTNVLRIKEAGNDMESITTILEHTERMQTKQIDFNFYMNA